MDDMIIIKINLNLKPREKTVAAAASAKRNIKIMIWHSTNYHRPIRVCTLLFCCCCVIVTLFDCRLTGDINRRHTDARQNHDWPYTRCEMAEELIGERKGERER